MADTASDTTAVTAAMPANGRSLEVGNARFVIRCASRMAISGALALLLVFVTEWISRGSIVDIGNYLLAPDRPGLAVVGVLFLVFLGLDALFGRAHQAALVLFPAALLLAFFSSQKQLYLSDPLYPSDMLFGRQIAELLPVMAAAQPLKAVAAGIGLLVVCALLVYMWIFGRRNFNAIPIGGRALRLVVAVPLLVAFVPLLDYTRFYELRDRLNMIPMMWDQQENYRHNGFLLAFAFNVPMTNVTAPEGYGAEAIDMIPSPGNVYGYSPSRQPDVIVVMSESLWDPTRLSNVELSKDPMPVIRANQSGQVFSPEFGGMTANVEFEALTGFSNAFLPYGSIPYQQYIRGELPSLATFFRSKGYVAKAFHPFQSWFWNRGSVYSHLGFESFLSEENLPAMEKRGIFASDASLTDSLIREADRSSAPFFFFAVTLQGHGPYEANRYVKNTVGVESDVLSPSAHASLATYAQGVREADDSLKRLMDWAKKRKRETIIVLFGDHLPPMGDVYTQTGYMEKPVATRKASPAIMAREHETPLVVWSSRRGVQKDLGSISPSQLPYHVVRLTGFRHPFYTGLLRDVQNRYAVVDRHQLIDREGRGYPDWQINGADRDPLLKNYGLLQYDMMFGKAHAGERYFPELGELQPST
ncbi:LTA synthase family protein [Ciceribacter sp. L1K23]|uniref:LTA synthase family protein n=1 Tax=Ciceribacter sp. L1K23 TaxID=2820276 RepID=UPI00201241B2|nr:LTA synthase family protein [Ciceribacter sp. L1K23]